MVGQDQVHDKDPASGKVQDQLKNSMSSDRCCLVGWVSSCKAKGHQFDSWPGHMSGHSPWLECIWEAAKWCFSHQFLPLSYALPSPLSKTKLKYLKIIKIAWALAGVAQWIEHRHANQKAAGSIPGQGTCLGCWPGPWLGERERQLINESLKHWCFSPPHP